MADEQNKIDKKAEKARNRELMQAKKKQNAGLGGDMMVDDAEEGSKFAVVFVTVVIVVIWLAILVLLIKWDVGGFGSTVMSPILKDVPYVNQILPKDEKGAVATETEYPYKNMEEAIAYIKQLELQLQKAQQGQSDNSALISQLQAETEKLKKYESKQAEFESEKEKFYNEVVFSTEAPDIDKYKKYYESIDPANAEALYKQVVTQEQANTELTNYVSSYSKMKPKEAAEIFNTMTDNLDLVTKILEQMKPQARADILGNMNADIAAKITKIMNPQNK
jgi:flagellar motility protein MotE (MotC chaperone)